jgi:hypothetical protein
LESGELFSDFRTAFVYVFLRVFIYAKHIPISLSQLVEVNGTASALNGLRSRGIFCDSGGGADVDSAWDQKKPEARKMLACNVPQAQVNMRHAT